MKIQSDDNSKLHPAQCGPTAFLGKVFLSPGVYEYIPLEDVVTALRPHRVDDWGSSASKEYLENKNAIREGFYLMSVLYSRDGLQFWIISEPDRSSTRVLFPDEF